MTDLHDGSWIIDETVEAINAAAEELVRTDERLAAYRDGLADAARRAAYGELRRTFFLPVRPLKQYLDALAAAGFRIRSVDHSTIAADTAEWTAFLSAYHEGVLGWVGGSERIEGAPPTQDAVAEAAAPARKRRPRLRRRLLRRRLDLHRGRVGRISLRSRPRTASPPARAL